MSDTIFKLLLALIPVAGIIITGFLIPLIKSKIDGEALNKIVKWVNYAVKCAEMIYIESGKGESKKQFVKDFINKMFNNKKTTISDEQIDVLIESAVEEMNKYKK